MFKATGLLILFVLLLGSLAPAQTLTTATLVLGRPGGFAAHPWLDAGLRVTLAAEADVEADFFITSEQLVGQQMPREVARRSLRRTLPPGTHEVHLMDEGRFFWLIGLEQDAIYRLHGVVKTAGESTSLGSRLFTPHALGEEEILNMEDFPRGGAGALRRFRLILGAQDTATSAPLAILQDDSEHKFVLTGPARAAGVTAADIFLAGSLPRPALDVVESAMLSGIENDNLVWLKTLEWRFNASPYGSGWEPVAAKSPTGHIQPYYATDSTRKLADQLEFFERSPRVPRRLHRLAIEAKGEGDLSGGWRLVNLFRAPISDAERMAPGRDHPHLSYDYTNRLLRFEAIVSASVPGDRIPPIRFTVEGDAFVYTYHVERLEDEAGATLGPGAFTRVVFYLQPPHYLGGVSRRIDFAFELAGLGPEGGTVNLENLMVWETPIADLPPFPPDRNMPMGLNIQARTEPWPEVSMLRDSVRGTTATIKPMTPNCGAEETDGGRHYFADHTAFLDEENRWHLYGIYNTRQPFTPLGTNGEPLPNSPYNAGLIHARACAAGAAIDATISGRPELAAWRGAAFEGPDRRTRDVFVDPDVPAYFFGPWAPTVIRNNDRYLMFYNENDLENPSRRKGFRYAWTFTPGDPASWVLWMPKPGEQIVYTLPQRSYARDLHVSARTAGETTMFDAVWAGYKTTLADDADVGSGKVLAKSVADDPRLFPTVGVEGEYVVYDLHQSDSGRIDSECESPTLVHDSRTGVFYLKVTKNGTWYPGHKFDNDVLTLDRTNRRLLLGERTMGDRSVLLGGPEVFGDPIAMVPLESFPRWVKSDFDKGMVDFSYRVAVLDAGGNGRGPALLNVDTIDGVVETFPGEKLRNPQSLARIAFVQEGERVVTGCVVSDAGEGPGEGRILLAGAEPSASTMSPLRTIATGLTNPRALYVETAGDKAASAPVLDAEGNPVLKLWSVQKGIRSTPFNGRILVGIQVPEHPGSPLTVTPYYGSYFPDLHITIMLETDAEGKPISTASQVGHAMHRNQNAKALMVARMIPGAGDSAIVPQALELAGGADSRRLFFADEGGVPGRPHIYAMDLSDPDKPSKPVVAVSSEVDWDPISLLKRDQWLLVLDAKRNAIWRFDATDPLAAAKDESAILLRNLPPACSITMYRDFLGDDVVLSGENFVGRIDLETGAVSAWMGGGKGWGAPLGELVSALPVSWNMEGIDAGAKVYWSRLDPRTGRILPFRAENYIGYLPYYASELHEDPNHPGRPWYASFNETNRVGGYGIRRIEWLPPLGAQEGP